MHECLETEIGDALANRLQVIEGVLARQHHALHAELLEHRGPGAVVHRRLRRAVDLQIWVQLPNQADEAEVLNDHRVNAAVDCLTEKGERLGELTRFDENIQGEIDASAAAVRDATRISELVECELGAFVARVEALGPEINGVGTIRDGGANGVERAGGR